ncbi:MAG: T9SS type A sorting domain-containing protein [Ignavibacteriaceae bacterium]|nr:T9SS type A sorting domain-containing protein [Ignavibacteriaceae bacterium]
MGPHINSPSIEDYALEISQDTLYTIDYRWAAGGVCIFIKDTINNTWKIVDSSNYNHPFGYGDTRGVSITGDRKKAYFSKYVFGPLDTLQSELFVTYRDTIMNRWGATYKLNINSTAFQPTGFFGYIGGWDEYPWISPDGKTLIFTSNRDAAREDTVTSTDLYISYLLVDEDGDTVTSVNDDVFSEVLISSFELFQNYPNPFNPSTLLSYQIPKDEIVTLKVYDILGREVKTLVNDFKEKGRYEVTYDASSAGGGLASGLYIYEIKSGDYKTSKKMTLIK